MRFENEYSMVDRLLHRVAFKTPRMQIDLSELEESIFKGQLKDVRSERPVFITGLPRAGTTLVLELCCQVDEFASHRYRDMPFLLLPMLWNRFSRSFRRGDELRERAHGDGVMINTESAEALEEIVWRPFWAEQYRVDRIEPWGGDPATHFGTFFRNHMRKIIALREADGMSRARYISKNNLNISRIPLLLELFSDATVVIPHRAPLSQSASLLRQHLNFLEMHRKDAFARQYMEGVGHYDFGDNLRPINFNDWMQETPFCDPQDLHFWLVYWTAAYERLLEHVDGDRVHLLSYENLCNDPRRVLAELADVLGIHQPEQLAGLHGSVRRATALPPPGNYADLDREVLMRAQEVHERLLEATL